MDASRGLSALAKAGMSVRDFGWIDPEAWEACRAPAATHGRLVLWGARGDDVQVGSLEDRGRRRHELAFHQLALAIRAGRIAHEFDWSFERVARALAMDAGSMERLRRQIEGLR
ncbi:MAG TPA: hypothetical protein VEW67_04110 [Thermoleophilaceae bacterium]|nr:hypothetical protein [Thermoleophilaceae bacterium]